MWSTSFCPTISSVSCLRKISQPLSSSLCVFVFIASDGAILLANILRRRKIEVIDLKLNPILAEGAIHIFSLVNVVELTSLNLSSCSFDESVGDTLVHVLKFSKSLISMNLSINKLSEELGTRMVQALASNSVLRTFDIRNTEISLKTKSTIDALILENREKNNSISQ